MNPIDDLIKFLSSNPYADNKTIFNKFPQLSGNAKLATRAKAYVMGVSSGEYNRNDLDENFSDVVGMFTPKNMDIYKGIDKIHTDDKSVEPTRNENQRQGNAGGLTKEQAAQKLQEYYANQQKQQINEDDPIGSEFNNLHQQKQYIQSLYSNRDATSQKINPMQTFEASNEMSDINAGIKRVLDYQNNGVPVNTNDAKDWLNEQIKKNRDDLPDVDGLSIQEIAKNIPQTLTNKSVLKTYEKSRNVFDAIKTSNTIQQAALRWGRMNPKYEQDIMLSTGEVAENNPNVVNKDLMRDILIDFIKQPATVEWAYKNPENLKTFRIAYNNLESTYPELRKTRIVEAIQNEREKMSNNSGWYNSPGKETTDNIVDNLSKSGVLNAVDVKYYKDEIRPKLGFWRGVGRDIGNVIPIVQTFVNDDPLHTPGILENMSRGYKDILHKTARGVEDIPMLFTNISNNDAISSKYQLHPQFKAKSGWHELTDFGGKMIGELIPIITTGVAGKIVGASEKLSTGIGFALSALDDTVKIAKTEFPNDAFKQIGYTGLMTAFNVALGYIIPDGRPKELTKGIRDDIKNVISNFTDGTITKEAAMKSAKDVFYNLVSEKAPEYISKVAEHNLKGGTFMTAPVIIDHALKKIFGGQSENEELNAVDVINNFMLGFLASTPLSALSAHGDISNKRVVRESIWNITGRPEYFKNIIKGSSFKNNPDVIENLQTALMVREELDRKTELTNHQKKEYLLQSLNEKVLQKQLDNTTDSVLKEKIKERINQSKEIRENILTRRENQLDGVAEKQKEKEENDNKVKRFADRISKGEKMNSPDDLQFYENNKQAIETELKNKAINDINRTEKEPEVLQTETVGENNGRGEVGIPDSETRVGEVQGIQEANKGTVLEPYYTKNGKYTVSYEEGKRVVKGNDGNTPSESIQKKVLGEHAENFKYNNGEEIKSEPPQFKEENEAVVWEAENATNPSQLADLYIRTPKEAPKLSQVEQAIADYGVGKVTQESYKRFGDKNNINNAKARAYFEKKSATRPMAIDTLAKSISDHAGIGVTPQDIVNFIDRFPSGGYQAFSLRDGDVHVIAKRRFEELTGIPLTDKVAKMAAQQYYTPEQIAQARIDTDHQIETLPLPEGEIKKWLTEEAAKEFEQNETFDNLDTYEQVSENIAGENISKPEPKESVGQNTSAQEGAGAQGDIRQYDPAKSTKEQRQVSESSAEGLEQASSTKSYDRIPVSPIEGTAKKISDIVHSAGKNLQQRILYLKPGQGRRRVLGTYSPSNKGVKIKYEGDLDTTAHELGHAIDDHYRILPEIEKNAAAVKELEQFADFGSKPPKNHPNPEQYIRAEGFAEWLRAFVVNPEQTKKSAPEVSKIFESVVPEESKKAINEFSEDVRTWAGATAKDQILSNVEVEAKKENALLDLLTKKESSNKFSVSWLDNLAANFTNPLKAFEKAFNYAKGLKGIDEVLPENDPTILARILNGVDGKFGEILKTGMIDAKGEVLKVDGKAMDLKWLLEPLENSSEKEALRSMEDVIGYMIAERTVELSKRFSREEILTGIGAGIFKDGDVAQKALNEYNAHPRIEQIKEAANRYRTFADATLRYLVEKGRLGMDQYQEIKENNLQYVALQRVLEAEPNQEVIVFQGGGKSLGSKSDPIKKIKGSTKKISNPYVSLLDTLYKSVKEADRNEVLRAFRDMVHENRSMYSGDTKRLSDIGVIGKAGDKNAITIFVDGKPEHWVFQEDVYKAIKNLGADVYKIPGIFTLHARILRGTVTNFPVFAARNWVRDFQDRLIKSNSNKGLSGFTSIVGKREDWHRIARMGGLNTGFYMKDKVSYYGMLREAMHEMSRKKSMVIDAFRFKHWYEKYHDALYKSETSNRVAEYRSAFKKFKDQGYDDYNASLKASYESRDLIDFALMGYQMKWINQVIPFSNAAVQGLRSSIVKASDNPGGFAMRTILYSVIPGAVLWYLNHRDDETANEYESLPSYQRDMFWNFKIGANDWLSIPKPFEISLPAAAVDRMLSYNAGNKNAYDGYVGTIRKSLIPLDESAIMGGFAPLIEIKDNKDWFRDKSIIPPHEEQLNLQLRKTDAASRLSKELQKVTNTDARYLDHFISSQFSYFGNMALKLSNIGDEDARNKFNKGDLGFFKQTPAYNSPQVQDMLEFAKEWGLTRSKEYQLFGDLAEEYFKEKDDETKDKFARELVDYANNIMKVWKEDGVDKRAVEKKKAKSNVD